jgi:rare lipoprotein A
VKGARALSAAAGFAVAIGLSACFSAPSQPRAPAVTSLPPGTPPPVADVVPPLPSSVPDIVPRDEPRSLHGNPPFYDVFGKRYFVLSSSSGYLERGVASWYGPGFHKVRTSTGEMYDMYGMTAAHTTLPLPVYVRVTNLQNGRSVVVRVNDRGPFVANRIIDLSYTAAAKLDMLRNGTAFVEVRAIDASSSVPSVLPATVALTDAPAQSPSTLPLQAATAPPTTPPGAAGGGNVAATSRNRALYVQAGAFADPANAERLAAKLRGGGYGTVFVRDDQVGGRRLYRVRIGPVSDVAEFDRVLSAMSRAGMSDAHLALD